MKKHKAPHYVRHYTLMHEITASPTQPLPPEWRTHQLTSMWDGLHDLETHPNPDTSAWRVCSDAVNLMETLVEQREVEDTQGLLMDAIAALAEAGKRPPRWRCAPSLRPWHASRASRAGGLQRGDRSAVGPHHDPRPPPDGEASTRDPGRAPPAA